MHLFYVLSLRIAASEAGVEEILVEGPDIVVRFRQPRAVDATRLSRLADAPIRARSNQVRMLLSRGASWMPKLRELVEALAGEDTSAEKTPARLR